MHAPLPRCTTPPISCNGSPMRSPSAIRRSTSARSTNRPMEPLAVAPVSALPRGAALGAASVEELFEAAGALRTGHLQLKSGRHTDRYLEKVAVLPYRGLT